MAKKLALDRTPNSVGLPTCPKVNALRLIPVLGPEPDAGYTDLAKAGERGGTWRVSPGNQVNAEGARGDAGEEPPSQFRARFR
jgi:hypothetical protein